MQKLKKILFVQFSSQPDGSTQSGLILVNGFKEKGWETFVAFAHEGPMIKEFQDMGHSTAIVPHKSWLRRKSILKFSKDFYLEWKNRKSFNGIIRTFKPDLVYINTSVSISAAFAAKSCNIPVVWHLRELPHQVGGEMVFPSFLKSMVQVIFLSFSSKIITNSKNVSSVMLGDKHQKKSTVVYNAIDEKYFQTTGTKEENQKKLNNKGNFKYLIGVPGMLRSMKGHLFLLETIAAYFKEGKSIKWVITGTGSPDYVNQLKSFIVQNGLEENVQLLGSISDMPSFYQACDLIIVPSKSEPFGRTVVEAMASRVPVIGTRVGGIPEIIRDGENGFLVDYGDNITLKSKINEIINCPLKNVVEVAFKESITKFSIYDYQKKILKIISAVESPGQN